jgi:ABC-type sugar transport system permease subunit
MVVASREAGRRAQWSETWRRVKKNRVAYLFIAPNIVTFLVFGVFPLLFSLYISLTRWSTLRAPRFVGLENFANLLEDPIFLKALTNTVVYTLLYVLPDMTIAFFLALLLHRVTRLRSLYTLACYIPVVTSTIIVALIFRWMYNPDLGLINSYLLGLGIPRIGWLTDPNVALVSLVLMNLWKSAGYNMVLFLAALQGVPEELHEAAAIDGAGWWRRLANVTVPLLRPTILFVAIMSTIGSFQVFNSAYVLTQGGPAYATTTLVYFVYSQGFEFFNMGYAAAVSYVLFAILLVVALVQRRLLGWGEELY